ncbi:MAG: choice-of-anchor O protein, partial [Xanthomonadales bacterium]|nr:choice-of-anchor O protein [Xanthomonadales bacterium]
MMKRLRSIIFLMTALAFALSGTVGADDGAITNKSMSKNIHVPIFEQEVVNEKVSEAEHAFTDFMKFYVPAQKASGELLADTDDGGIVYCDIDGQLVKDNEPNQDEDKECQNTPVEILGVAKPLINVFIYGPQFEPEGTAFGHSFFDTYAAVSLDDGETWKKTNLSESADRSSFNLEEDHKASKQDPLPSDHNIFLSKGNGKNGAYHKRGYETPYTAHCSECHGTALQGTAQTPSCYSCHSSKRFEEETPIELGPIVTLAVYRNNKLMVYGENALPRVEVTIINGETGHELASKRSTKTGKFGIRVRTSLPPCTVAAYYTDSGQIREQGPAVAVVDRFGENVEECEGHPVDLNEYPGGTYNVFRAVAGNKVLVAWPSRFCSSGQPAYSLTTDNDDDENGIPVEEKVATATAIANFIHDGNDDLGVPALPDFTSPFDANGDLNLTVDDLYLFDAFGVAGSQGSVDFADEGYPQAGVVPFGCVWTARGVMLPGDDERTEDFVESSHMVWTKAERLTSGRRDPNRIEVHAVQGAGFVITWQEDPEGLRPGQGLGPGEGWSGAVAHAQTDAWYSFINEEYFDIVKTAYEDTDGKVAYTMDPIDILDHDLT